MDLNLRTFPIAYCYLHHKLTPISRTMCSSAATLLRGWHYPGNWFTQLLKDIVREILLGDNIEGIMPLKRERKRHKDSSDSGKYSLITLISEYILKSLVILPARQIKKKFAFQGLSCLIEHMFRSILRFERYGWITWIYCSCSRFLRNK